MTGRSRRAVRVTEPGTLRALAHPTRLQLLGELRARGPLTVGMLCAVVDEAPGSVSYHMNKLAEHGFVEEDTERARDKRERWWRAVHTTTVFEPAELIADPARRTALHAFRQTVLQRHRDMVAAYFEAEASLDAGWVAAASMGDAQLHLTVDELGELRAELEELVRRWEQRSDPHRRGARLVTMIYHAFARP